jgi:hypothetical protein
MFQSKASIVGVAISVVIGIVLLVMQLSISTSLTSSVSGSMASYAGFGDSDSYYGGKTEGPVLDPTRIVPPKGGNGKMAELDISDDRIPSAQIIIDDGSGAVDFQPKVEEEPTVGLSEDAGIVEKSVFFLGVVWRWILGDRGDKEDSYEMNCKPKKGGGKVCTIVR